MGAAVGVGVGVEVGVGVGVAAGVSRVRVCALILGVSLLVARSLHVWLPALRRKPCPASIPA